jgi:putative addiction module killer protein
MPTYPYKIDYYATEQGGKPFKDWLEGLRDVQGRARIRVRLDRVRLGNLGAHRSGGAGVQELRIDFDPGYRLYFGLAGKRVVLLFLGGGKSSQSRDIAKAREFWQDHQRRSAHD